MKKLFLFIFGLMLSANCFAWDEYTKAVLHFNGADGSTTITDEVGILTWTASGNAQLDTAEYKFSTASLLLDGTDDYIYTPDSPSLTLGSSDWTFDLWVKRDAINVQDRLFGQLNSGANATSWAITANINTLNKVTVSCCSGSTFYTATSTGTIGTDWTALSFERYGNTITIYINGTASGTKDVTGVTFNDSVNNFSIGRLGEYNDADEFDGWKDEFRISIGIARHQGNYTPADAPYADSYIPDVIIISD